MSTAKLSLTPQQTAEIEKAFGHKVTELHFSVEEFGIEGAAASKMRVLKISNIAEVNVAGVSGVVN